MILRETGTIPASAIPVQALAEQLRLGHGFTDDGAENAYLERLLRHAIGVVEQRLSLALIRRGFELEVDAWTRHGHLVLPVGPVDAIQTFELRLDALVSALEPGHWRLKSGTGRQQVTGPRGGSLPLLAGDLTARLVFEAGFGPAWTDVPEDLARAVLMLAAHEYDNPSGPEGQGGMPAGVMALVDLRRQVRL